MTTSYDTSHLRIAGIGNVNLPIKVKKDGQTYDCYRVQDKNGNDLIHRTDSYSGKIYANLSLNSTIGVVSGIGVNIIKAKVDSVSSDGDISNVSFISATFTLGGHNIYGNFTKTVSVSSLNSYSSFIIGGTQKSWLQDITINVSFYINGNYRQESITFNSGRFIDKTGSGTSSKTFNNSKSQTIQIY